MKRIVQLFSDAASAYGAIRGSRLAAALAFYAILSLSPLLIVVVGITQTVVGSSDSVRIQLTQAVQRMIGGEGASMIIPIIESASQQDSNAGLGLTIIGIVIALFTASNVFAQLQDILNRIWRVQIPKRPILVVVQERAVGMLMVLLAGVILLLLFVLNTALRTVVFYFADYWILTGGDWLQVAQVLTTVVLLAAIFALMFRTLPESHIAWRDVWIGALFTAIAFALGLQLIGWYLTFSTAGSAYGQAASLLITLLAFYYAAQIFLFGAQFTYVFSQSRYGVSNSGGDLEEQEDAAPVPS